MKNLLLLLAVCLIIPSMSFAQRNAKTAAEFQAELNEDYKDPKKSPLPKDEIADFKGLNFFPVDNKYRIEAQFVRLDGTITLEMPTTKGRKALYDIYALAIFELEGNKYMLRIYQSHRLRDDKEYKDYLFLPFTDLTNGEGSYGGGRYMDVQVPRGNTIILDFNKSYNPYCAYSDNYSCPIPPKENHIDVAIHAGVMAPEK